MSRPDASRKVKPRAVNRFLRSLPPESQLTLLTDLVEQWGALGADKAMLESAQDGDEAMNVASTPCRRASDRATLKRIEKGLRMVTVPLPHLAGSRPRCASISTGACRPWACSRRAG